MKIKSWVEFTKVDDRVTRFAGRLLTDSAVPGSGRGGQSGSRRRARLPDSVPVPGTAYFDAARSAYSYGVFAYDLFAIAAAQGSFAEEFALEPVRAPSRGGCVLSYTPVLVQQSPLYDGTLTVRRAEASRRRACENSMLTTSSAWGPRTYSKTPGLTCLTTPPGSPVTDHTSGAKSGLVITLISLSVVPGAAASVASPLG